MIETRNLILLRQYEPEECGPDGYPVAWHQPTVVGEDGYHVHDPAIKDLIRAQAGHRCVRCMHPYRKGDPRISERGEWSPCDEYCEHYGEIRIVRDYGPTQPFITDWSIREQLEFGAPLIEARWKILTVHHLDEDKANCRWWNLASLCQKCHLRMQHAVVMDRPWNYEHSDWFKPYAAGFYGWKYLGEDLTRVEVCTRIEELLALEHKFTREALF